MKHLILALFALALCVTPCHAQFGVLGKIYKVAKAATKSSKAADKASDDWGNKKVKDIMKDVPVDTTSEAYKKAVAEAQKTILNSDPRLKKIMELKDDTAALSKYMKEQYGGMTEEEIAKKTLGSDYNSKDYQTSHAEVQKMSGFTDDPVFKKIMTEKRQPTMEEARYLNDKYGTTFEYEGIEAYNDSVGVFAQIDGQRKPMSIGVYEQISDERPLPDFGQGEIKQFVQNTLSFLKKPLADREVVDSVQNYLIYNHRHAEAQFKGIAHFTLYSNLETDNSERTVNEVLLRLRQDFTEPIDPSRIFVFKVHKGMGCRFMEYRYSKISYKQSELNKYVTDHLMDGGYIDANIDKKMSDDQMFKTMDKLEYQFKLSKLLQKIQNDERFVYYNVIPAAKNVKITSHTRKVGGHVSVLDLNIEAEPGEYAFIIRDPEVEEYMKGMDFDVSVLSQGAFFFTIKK